MNECRGLIKKKVMDRISSTPFPQLKSSYRLSLVFCFVIRLPTVTERRVYWWFSSVHSHSPINCLFRDVLWCSSRFWKRWRRFGQTNSFGACWNSISSSKLLGGVVRDVQYVKSHRNSRHFQKNWRFKIYQSECDGFLHHSRVVEVWWMITVKTMPLILIERNWL